MHRRIFSRKFKLKAVKLVIHRGAGVAQATLDLDVADIVVRRWMREAEADSKQACSGKGQAKPEQQGSMRCGAMSPSSPRSATAAVITAGDGSQPNLESVSAGATVSGSRVI